jgi:hypothetical protein
MHQLTGAYRGGPTLGISLRGSGTFLDGPDETREARVLQLTELLGRFTDPPHVVKAHAAAPAMGQRMDRMDRMDSFIRFRSCVLSHGHERC